MKCKQLKSSDDLARAIKAVIKFHQLKRAKEAYRK